MLRVSVIANSAAVRHHLQTVASQPGQTVCSSVHHSVKNILSQKDSIYVPEIILLQTDHHESSEIHDICLLREHYPGTEIIILVPTGKLHLVHQYIFAGVIGCMLENSTLAQIRDAINTVSLGGIPLDPKVFHALLSEARQQKNTLPIGNLTTREQDILYAITDGLSYKLVADQLNLSLETVRHHIKNIYRKLHINSKGELISKVLGTRLN